MVAAIVMAYSNSFSGAFLLDDHTIITDNPELRRFQPIILSTRFVADQTFKLNYLTGGLKPADYHATNLLIHILVALLLYGIIRRTLLMRRFDGAFTGNASLLAGLSATCWAVHPLQTQGVTYVCQRYECIMGLFLMLSLYCFIRGYGSGRERFWYDLSIVACLVGMWTKETMVMAPFVILAYDFVFVSGSVSALRARWKVHAALMLSVGLVVAAVVVWSAGGVGVAGRQHVSPLLYLLNQCKVIAYYLKLALVPHPLCFDYAWQPSLDIQKLLPFAAAIGAIFVLTVISVVRRHVSGFLGVFFFLLLAPTSSVVPFADLAVEHRMYLPLAAVIVTVVTALWKASTFVPASGFPFYKVFSWTAAVAVLATFSWLTYSRNADYQSEETMWRDVVNKRPGNLRAKNDLAVALSEAGRFEEAVKEYDRVITSIPPEKLDALEKGQLTVVDVFDTNSCEYHYFRANSNKALLMSRQSGGENEALRLYVRALKVAPINIAVRAKVKEFLRRKNIPENRLDDEIRTLLGAGHTGVYGY